MGLDVPYTYLFFVIFTRFEFALKDRGILRNDRDEIDAVPGWERLRKSLDMPKDSDHELSASISKWCETESPYTRRLNCGAKTNSSKRLMQPSASGTICFMGENLVHPIKSEMNN